MSRATALGMLAAAALFAALPLLVTSNLGIAATVQFAGAGLLVVAGALTLIDPDGDVAARAPALAAVGVVFGLLGLVALFVL